MLSAVISRRLVQVGTTVAGLSSGSSALSGGSWSTLHTSASLAASLQVKIPALGESISDGTVSAVLKQAGDQVEEDEPILQIETDKVTVDVRSPQAGIIEAILVKPDDNVVVGHVVASIRDSVTPADPLPAAAMPAPQPAAPSPPKEKKKRGIAKVAAAPAVPAAVAQEALAHRVPAIRFPLRRTPDGQSISMLPKLDAQQLLAAMLGDGEEGEGGEMTPRAGPMPEQYKDMIAVPIVGGSMPILRGPPVPAGPPGPARRTISEREMEAIMLGGADP